MMETLNCRAAAYLDLSARNGLNDESAQIIREQQAEIERLNGTAGRIARVAACGTAENFLALSDDDKRLHFAHSIDESTRRKAAEEEVERLQGLINAPELNNFLRAVHIEAVHQVERWGTAHDRAKRPADWFWLVGYLGGKALHAAVSGDTDKAKHHCISTAAALYNWHCAISGTDVRMCPGRSDLAEVVEATYPGETV